MQYGIETYAGVYFSHALRKIIRSEYFLGSTSHREAV